MASETLPYAKVRLTDNRRLIPASVIAGIATGLLAGCGWWVATAYGGASRFTASPANDLPVLADAMIAVVWAGAMFAIFVWARESVKRKGRP